MLMECHANTTRRPMMACNRSGRCQPACFKFDRPLARDPVINAGEQNCAAEVATSAVRHDLP
jgi:hypothetical protein